MVEMTASGVGSVVYTKDFFWTDRGSDLLGRGSFGQVHKGRNKSTGEFVAVKTCGVKDEMTHRREIKLLRSLDSNYIVKFVDAQQVEDGTMRWAIIMELAEGNVREELNRAENFFGLPYDMLLLLVSHLELGLSYLNEKMVAHRDVKPANILICRSWDGLVFKLCDFGGSRHIDSFTQQLGTLCGTPGYLNEYSAANLARNTRAWTYTKDECDLWSVGCTLFECATGRLPFLPANGLADRAGMHNMMASRPSDVVCGHADHEGRFVWYRQLPQDRCAYPESLQRMLCELLRRLFDRHSSTRLTFQKFSEYCKELTHLRKVTLFLPNSLTVEDYFDTSAAQHFERFNLDEDMRRRFDQCDLVCMFAMPSGTTHTQRLFLELRNSIEQLSQLAVLALVKEQRVDGAQGRDNYVVPVFAPLPATSEVPRVDDLQASGAETRFAIANELRLEAQIRVFGDYVAGITPFCDAFHDVLDTKHIAIIKRLDSVQKVVDAVRLQSTALSLISESPAERERIENNIEQASRELAKDNDMARDIGTRLGFIKTKIELLKAVKIPKHPSQKDKLETVIKNRMVDSRSRSCEVSSLMMGNNSLLIDTDCLLVWNALRNAIDLHRSTASRIKMLQAEHIEEILRTLYDLSRLLIKSNKQIDESTQLVTVAQDINQRRVSATNSLTSQTSTADNSQLCKALKVAKGDTGQLRCVAEESFRSTKHLLRDLM